MRTLTNDAFTSEFRIYQQLGTGRHRQNPTSAVSLGCTGNHKIVSALTQGSDGNPVTVVLKEIDEKRSAIYQELCGMWNPHLADTYEVLRVSGEKEPSAYYAVTEYVYAANCPEEERLSLTRFIQKNGPAGERTALLIGTQLCDGLKEFHKRGFVHRDLKPDNIMISEYDPLNPQIKIVDFGGAKWNHPAKGSDTTVIGTLGYQAPESLAVRTDRRADIYSIGCILNFLLTGQEPGLSEYHGNHYIVSMIEKATNEDSSYRYASVEELQKELDHLLGIRLIDRIPLLRALPGFRTCTLWKSILAGMLYISMIPIALSYSNLMETLSLFIPYVVIPLIVFFNMGNLQRFFPRRLRRNNRLFFKIRVVIGLVAFCEPIVLEYLLSILR